MKQKFSPPRKLPPSPLQNELSAGILGFHQDGKTRAGHAAWRGRAGRAAAGFAHAGARGAEAFGPARAGPAGRATGLFRRQRQAGGAQGREAPDSDGCRASVPCDRPGSSLRPASRGCVGARSHAAIRRNAADRAAGARAIIRGGRRPAEAGTRLALSADHFRSAGARGELSLPACSSNRRACLSRASAANRRGSTTCGDSMNEMLAMPWSDTASIALYEMNAVVPRRTRRRFRQSLPAGCRSAAEPVAALRQLRLDVRPRARGRQLPRASCDSRADRGGRPRGRSPLDAPAS